MQASLLLGQTFAHVQFNIEELNEQKVSCQAAKELKKCISKANISSMTLRIYKPLTKSRPQSFEVFGLSLCFAGFPRLKKTNVCCEAAVYLHELLRLESTARSAEGAKQRRAKWRFITVTSQNSESWQDFLSRSRTFKNHWPWLQTTADIKIVACCSQRFLEKTCMNS